MTRDSLRLDLSRLTGGEVFTDPVTCEVYATAACIYRILPMAVVRPRRADEVAAITAFARERGIPITVRGAGTAVAGQTLGAGIIIDFRAHLNQILEVDAAGREVELEPGVILAELNRELKKQNLVFPPDPSSGDYATIGGMIANNSSGARSLKNGDTRKWTARLKVVLSDGSMIWLEPKPPMPVKVALGSRNFENLIYSRLSELLAAHGEAVERSRPGPAKNSAGYHVWDLVAGKTLNPAPLVVGSEGTLAIVVKAALKLAELPAERGVALLAFDALDDAVAAVHELEPLSPSALELMDHLFISVVREHRPDLRELLPETARAVLLCEFEGREQGEAAALLERAGAVCKRAFGGRAAVKLAAGESEALKLWAVRKAASPILYRLPGKRLTRFVEDVVIPPARLAEGIRSIQRILHEHGTEAPVFGHAGSGNLHLNPRLDLADPEDVKKMRSIADQVYALVIALGGSITGEHGDGMLRAPYLKKQFPDLIPLFREIKALFDPAGILNPGKVLSDDDSIPLEPLKLGSFGDQEFPDSLKCEPLSEMILLCHGCGLCRTYCPVSRATGDERALPRSKVSILRALALGELDPEAETVERELDRTLALCTFCQRCLTGCPTGIEPARLIRAFLAERIARKGRPLRESFFAHSHQALELAARAPRLVRAVSQSRLTRRTAEIGLGIRRQAPFPEPTRDAVKKLSVGDEARDDARAVLYFPGCLGRYADREGETPAALALLAALGFNPLMPGLPCCGEAALLANQPGAARDQAARMLSLLEPYISRGRPVVTACHTCALTMKREYPVLLGEPAEPLVPLVFEFFQFLNMKTDPEQLDRAFGRAPLGKALYHRSCHQAALGPVDHVAAMLDRVPGLELVKVEDACCGLAGYFGMRIENAAVSDALAKNLLEAAAEAETKTVVSACPACRLQHRALGLEPRSAVVLLFESLSALLSSGFPPG